MVNIGQTKDGFANKLMKIIKIILLNIVLINICYSEDIKYTNSGIPIKFYGLLDLDHINYDTEGMDTNSLIFKIKNVETETIKNSGYIPVSR